MREKLLNLSRDTVAFKVFPVNTQVGVEPFETFLLQSDKANQHLPLPQLGPTYETHSILVEAIKQTVQKS